VTTTAKRLAPSRWGHAAAELTMIIQVNATVCGDMNHGQKRQHRIVSSNAPERV